MGDVKVLPGVAAPQAVVADRGAVPEVVAVIEGLLAHAREGKLRAIAYSFVDRAGSTFDGWASADDEATGIVLIGGVTLLQHEIVAVKRGHKTKPAPT
jgi:hypothetical protein